MARRQFTRFTYDQINVTNLIDTLFFLLIIFMITAPLLEYSVEVHPPQMNADKLKPDEKSKIINVKEDGTILFERRTITESELQALLHQLKTANPDESYAIYLRADAELKYGRVMHIMRMARSAGFRNIQLVMQEEPK